MSQRRFIPRMEAIEERTNPSVTATDVFAAMNQIQFDQFITQYVTQPGILSNPQTSPLVGGFLVYSAQHDAQAVGVMNEFVNDFEFQILNNPDTADFYTPYFTPYAISLTNGQADLSTAQTYATTMGVTIPPLAAASPPVTTTTATLPPTATSPPTVTVPPTTTSNTITSGDAAGMTTVFPDAATFTALGTNGVKIKDTQVGTGATTVQTGSQIAALYTLWTSPSGTLNQEQHVAATAQSQLFSIPSGVIAGFGEGVIGMKVGGIRQIFVPAAEGYGAGTGNNSSGKPLGDLVFEVKIVSIH